MGIPIVGSAFRTFPGGLETGGIGNQRKNSDHPGQSIVQNGQNPEKSPKELRRLAVTQTPVK